MNKGRYIEYKQFYCKEWNGHLPEVGKSGGEEECKVGYWAVNYSYTGARSPGILLSSSVTASSNYVVYISEG